MFIIDNAQLISLIFSIDRQMIIELRGVEFVNKGAELMLYSILYAVRKEFPMAIFVMESTDYAPRLKHRSLGIYTKSNIKKCRINFEYIFNFIPSWLLKKMFIIKIKNINIILDASGFALGDYWGPENAANKIANHIEDWKKQGKKIILLPQAFGPFENKELISKVKTVIQNSDLIFARDRFSFKYLQEVKASNIIHQRPDFTNLIDGIKPEYFNKKNCEIAIIPNKKLINSGVFKNKIDYVHFLFELVVYFENNQMKPFFLVHEGHDDCELVELVNITFNKKYLIIIEDNPLLVKGIIGLTKGVVTSRFHGLVSALTQAIPCLCIGWSHKYEAVLEEYDHLYGLIDKNEINNKSFVKKLKLLVNEKDRSQLIKTLTKKSKIQKKLSVNMWGMVLNLISR